MKKPDILIVGAGPVGLTLAIECARHGLTARIVDHNDVRSPYSKALAVWSATLECFAAMGVVEDFIKVGRPMRRLIFADRGTILNDIPSNRGIDSPYPMPLMLPQSETEEILEKHLASLGVTVERGVTLLQCSQADQEVRAELLKSDGSREELFTSFLAGCDGARSTVRHQLDLPFEGTTEPLGFVLIDAKIEGDLPDDGMFLNWGDNNTTTIFFPIKKGIFRLVAQRKDLTDHSTPTLEEMQGYLQETGLGHWRLYEPEWLSYFGVNERVATRNRVGNIFLLGDAAHIHSPAGGQGMNTGIQDAFNLGWKLALLAKKRGNAEMIAESYFEERHPVAKNLVRETSKLLHASVHQNFFTHISKDILVGLLLHIPLLQQLIAEKFSEMNIHYPSSYLIEHDTLSVDNRKHQAGWRVYEALLLDATTKEEVSLWKEFLPPQHTLLLFSGAYLSEERRLILEQLVKNPVLSNIAAKPVLIWHEGVLPSEELNTKHFLDSTGKAHYHFGIETPSWILVRPDLYVAARGFIEETQSLEAYCKKLI